MTKTRILAAAAAALAAAAAVVVLAAPAGSQTDQQPINTRVKLLEHRVKQLEARIATLAAPEIACTRGPNHRSLDVYDHEAGHRTVATFATYLQDCGPHGTTRQHTGSMYARSDKPCHDLDGMSATSTDPVPAAWATWWSAVGERGIDDACTTSADDAAAINAGTTTLAKPAELLLHHGDDVVLGWETYSTAQHPPLPTG